MIARAGEPLYPSPLRGKVEMGMSYAPRRKDIMQTVDRIVEVLEEAGIDHVFGIPGGDTGRIFKALYHKQDKIKVVVARDEQTAACMAEMYGRLTGRPGVFMAQGCYAASTGLFGAIEAALGSSPMVIITDITTYGVPSGHGAIQPGSPRSRYRPYGYIWSPSG